MMVSIILPVFNRISELSNGVQQLKTLLEHQDCTFEILIVDDGSEVKEEIRAIADQHGCGYLRNTVNAGKGMAVKKGMLAAKGDMVIFMDGDFPFHLSVVPDMISQLEAHKIVIGDRTLAGSEFEKESVMLRRAGSRILSAIINRFYVRGITDSQCGIKGFRADAGKAIFERVTLNGFSFDVEVLFIARKNQLQIERMPVKVFEQDGSSVKLFKDGLVMLFSLFKIMYNHAKGKYKINE